MLDNCRVCCESIQGISAKNLFNSKHIILLHHIELLTGEWLINHQNAPSFICICCEQDLKVSVALRERCIKSQRKLHENICASPPWETLGEDKMKEYLVDEFEYSVHNQRVDHCTETEHDCFGNEQEQHDVDIKDSVIYADDFNKGEDDFITELSDIEFEESPLIKDEIEVEVDIPDKISPEPSLHAPEPEKTRKFVNWRALSEEQIKEMKRKLRRRDCVCDQCGRHFNDPSNLKLHLIRHAGIKNFVCDVCGSKFYTPHLLKRHKLLHSEVKLLNCDYCDRTFKFRAAKIEHERIHRNEKPFKCYHCDKYFRSTSKRKDHQVVHTGFRQFHCELCDQHFMRSRQLKIHFLSKTHQNREQQTNNFLKPNQING